MAQPSPPPPSQSLPGAPLQDEFHGPRTNFFPRIRMQLAALEQLPMFKGEERLCLGLLIAFLTSATLATLISIVLQLALLPAVGLGVMAVIIAPLTEEPSKALGMLIVALFLWRIIPNRRYGAALGAAAGLGFGIAESIVYIYNLASVGFLSAGLFLTRLFVTPTVHLLFSAFVGIGVFVLVAQMAIRKNFLESLWGLPLLFLLIGMINHIVWNSIALLPTTSYLAIIFLDLVITFPIFAVVLRDFLGGHFNFQHFFEPLPEPSFLYPRVLPPPPPPPYPPPTLPQPYTYPSSPSEITSTSPLQATTHPNLATPTCTICRQPLTYIQQHRRWYCYRCQKYV